jgi:hypothetical protein
MNLYAMKIPNGKWGMFRTKAAAIRQAKEIPGAEVWSRLDVPEITVWDWPTFRLGAVRVCPVVTYFGTFTAYGYEIVRRYATATGQMTEAIYHAGNCACDSSQTFPAGAGGTLDIATIEEYCEQTGTKLASEDGGQWTGCTHDLAAEEEISILFAESA